jgi:hypothetical protein
MSDDKPTFLDPVTGEEIESTRLARLGARLARGLLVALMLALVQVFVFLWFGWRGGMREDDPEALGQLMMWFVPGYALIGFFAGLAHVRMSKDEEEHVERLTRRVHDALARWQHRRRRRQEESGDP